MGEHGWRPTGNVINGRAEYLCEACRRFIELRRGEQLPAHTDGYPGHSSRSVRP